MYVPLGQLMQLVDVWELEPMYLPAWHAMHELEDLYLPAPHDEEETCTTTTVSTAMSPS